jgi:ubiquitin C-terminal hydrolase
LYDCLEEFKKSEVLDEDNKWFCSKCKEHVQASKSLEIYRVPPVLVISLKRFKVGK